MTGIEGRLRFFGFAGVLVVFSISERPGLFILPTFLTNCNFHLRTVQSFFSNPAKSPLKVVVPAK